MYIDILDTRVELKPFIRGEWNGKKIEEKRQVKTRAQHIQA